MGSNLLTLYMDHFDPEYIVRGKIRQDAKIEKLAESDLCGLTGKTVFHGVNRLSRNEANELLKELDLLDFDKRRKIFQKVQKGESIIGMIQSGNPFVEYQQEKLRERLRHVYDRFMKDLQGLEWQVEEILPIGDYHFDVGWKKREDVSSKEYILFAGENFIKKGSLKELKEYAIEKDLIFAEICTNTENKIPVYSLVPIRGVLTDFGKRARKERVYTQPFSFYYAGVWV